MTPHTTKCQVDQIEGGYCTPTLCSCHEVILSAPGLEIASPFPVFASIPPTQLIKPVREIRKVLPEKPVHLTTLNSSGEVIVTGTKYVVAINAEGERVASLNLKQELNLLPWSHVADDSDMVYVVCRRGGGSYLIKLTPELKVVKMTDALNTKLRDISIVGSELVVCDEDKFVQIFTKELQFVRKIDLCSKTPISRLCSDLCGNLYVSARASPGVHIYVSDGQFLRSFGEDMLVNPCDLDATGGYIYATDQDILIYSTEGEYITSLSL